MKNILIIGGGAAGMMAAVHAARNGADVTLYEKNEKLGKKIYITGKGRCNFTNACDMEQLFEAVQSNPKFLYSSFYSYTNEQVIDFFEELGMHTKIERGERAFPYSDHASDVIYALEREMKRLGVRIYLNTKVSEVQVKNERFCQLLLANGTKAAGDACIITTGGLSYPTTGSTGDGYRFAEKMGHRITELRPALVPIEVKEWYAKELQGLSLRNVTARISDEKKVLYEEFGEMLFTHYGVSGPLILSASSRIGERLQTHPLELSIDLKPALSKEQLDQRVQREFQENQNRQFKNAIDSLFPSKLRPVMIELSGIPEEKKVHDITKEERLAFVDRIKNFRMTLTGLRGYNEAIITAGGISVKEVDPGTMESKLVPGVYFAGEVLDLDARTGGFNLQIAWSTGYLAGIGAAVK